jgi:6-phosphogluconolactonase
MKTFAAGSLSLLLATTMPASLLPIFIGTSSNTPGTNRGIYAVSLDDTSGDLTPAVLAIETPNPAFLAPHPRASVLFSSGEAGKAATGTAAGAGNAYTIDPASHGLALLNSEPTGGLAVTHLAADATGRMLIAVSYHGGQIVAFPIKVDGTLGPRSFLVQSAGQLGPNTARQDKPHPHSVTISPDNRHAYVCNLGLDRIFCFRLDPAAATLTPAGEFAAVPGAGPRHSKFSADGRFFYVVNEIDNTVAVYACDPASGALSARQVVSTLPADFTGTNTTAEIRLHPNGRFLYASNRGHDTLAVFARNERDGTLTRIALVPCGGRTPRNFALTPDGRWLVCANLDSGTLTSFRVDAATGLPTATGSTASVPSPTCVLFAGPF